MKLGFLLSLGMALSFATSYAESSAVVSSPDGELNIREHADSNSALVETLHNDQSLTIVEGPFDGWVKVQLADGKTGYAKQKYLAEASGAKAGSQTNEDGDIVLEGEFAVAIDSPAATIAVMDHPSFIPSSIRIEKEWKFQEARVLTCSPDIIEAINGGLGADATMGKNPADTTDAKAWGIAKQSGSVLILFTSAKDKATDETMAIMAAGMKNLAVFLTTDAAAKILAALETGREKAKSAGAAGKFGLLRDEAQSFVSGDFSISPCPWVEKSKETGALLYGVDFKIIGTSGGGWLSFQNSSTKHGLDDLISQLETLVP